MTVGVVTLGGITFNAGPDSDGDRFTVSDVEGWWSAPAELVTVDKPLGAGSVIAYGRTPARALSVIGHASGSTIQNGFRAARKLEAAVAGMVTADGTLTVDEGSAVYQLTVRVAGTMDVRRAGPYAIEFAIDLLAVSPAKTTV